MKTDEIIAEIREILIKNAVDSTYYVALGKVLRRELSQKYGMTEDRVGGILSVQACQIVDAIRNVR